MARRKDKQAQKDKKAEKDKKAQAGHGAQGAPAAAETAVTPPASPRPTKR